MTEPTRPPIAELLANRDLITAAIRQGVREAIRQHAQAGNPIATWREGEVVWVPAAEVLAQLAAREPPG